MFCSYCGKKIPDDAVYCSFCGMKLKNSDPDQNLLKKSKTTPAPNPFQQPQISLDFLNNSSSSSSSSGNKNLTDYFPAVPGKIKTYLTESIVLCIFVPLLGITAVVYASKASAYISANDLQRAKTASDSAKKWFFGSLIFLIIIIIIGLSI